MSKTKPVVSASGLDAVAWDAYALITMGLVLFLQVLRWRMFPQFMDIQYHLHTAWGFLQAGGYSGWDFWEFAPAGRVHIYPPVMHVLLAIPLALGAGPILIAKVVECFFPVAFLAVAWLFMRAHFGEKKAFFVLAGGLASLPFFMSLINHIPATAACIIGLGALDQLLRRNIVRAVILLSACFYTHIGVSWFFALTVLCYGLLDRAYFRTGGFIFLGSVLCALPMLAKLFMSLPMITTTGMGLNERFFCQFKIVEYLLAFYALWAVVRRDRQARIFAAMFVAGFIFAAYPYRFFTAEGYLPIVFLSGLGFERLVERLRPALSRLGGRWIVPAVVLWFLLSVTVGASKPLREGVVYRHEPTLYKVFFAHTALKGLVLPLSPNGQIMNSIWSSAQQSLEESALAIRQNSLPGDIVFQPLDFINVTLGNLAQRACAHGLFAETRGPADFDSRVRVSRIVVFARTDSPESIQRLAGRFGLRLVSENKLFSLFVNPYCRDRMQVRPATISFWVIGMLAVLVGVMFIRARGDAAAG